MTDVMLGEMLTSSKPRTDIESVHGFEAMLGLEPFAIPFELHTAEILGSLQSYVAWRWDYYRHTIHPVCLQLQLELLAGFPWPWMGDHYLPRKKTFPQLKAPTNLCTHMRTLRLKYGIEWRSSDPGKRLDHAPGYPDPEGCIRQAHRESRMVIYPLRDDLGTYVKSKTGAACKRCLLLSTSRAERETPADERYDGSPMYNVAHTVVGFDFRNAAGFTSATKT